MIARRGRVQGPGFRVQVGLAYHLAMNADEVIARLKTMGSPANVEGMARFGISTDGTLGISIPALRAVAKPIRKEWKKEPERLHALAAELWASGIHEARILAEMLEVPGLVTPEQMDAWVVEVDSWDICDGLAMGVFSETPYAVEKAVEWAEREEEFVKRAAFAMMATFALKRHAFPDQAYEPFFALIRKHATDDRNFVKKAVNWALRQIGKRNDRLLARAIEVAREIEAMDSRSARWIAKDALRELLPRVRRPHGSGLGP
jgi:3-methyladenine DNA glycosylase AlkD